MFTRICCWGLFVMLQFYSYSIPVWKPMCYESSYRNSSLFLRKKWQLLLFNFWFLFFNLPLSFFFFLLCFVLFFKLIVPITRLWVSLFHRNSSRWVWMSRRLENTPWSMENTQHFGRYSSFFNWNIAIITIYWLLNDSTNCKFWRWSNSI